MKVEKENQLWKHLVAGAVAGAMSRTMTAPLDRVKVYHQVKGAEIGNLRSCFAMLLRDGGWPALWRGNGMNVLKIAPETAIKFMLYEKIKRVIRDNSSHQLEFKERLIAGASAGALSQTVIYPLEVLKTRLVLRQTSDHRGIVKCASRILNNEGWRSFYRGYLPNLLGILPYAGVDLAIYETLKRYLLKVDAEHDYRNHPHGTQFLVLSMCGVISSSCGQLVSYPLALIRTRLQAQSTRETHTTMSILSKDIYNKEGIRGFYRGIVPNFMKVAPAVGISYFAYEYTRNFLGADMC